MYIVLSILSNPSFKPSCLASPSVTTIITDYDAIQEDEEVAQEDEDDMGVIETYSNYKPTKLKVGLPHPDPVVETASLASVEPADVW